MSFDTQISALEEQIEAMREPMRAQTERWLDATAAWAAEFWEEKSRELVRQNAEHAKSLSEDERAGARGEVNSLIANARQRAGDHFLTGGNAAIWPHLQEDTREPLPDPYGGGGSSMFHRSRFFIYDSPGRPPRRDGPTGLQDPVHLFAGLVGEVMRRHGFRPHIGDVSGPVKYYECWSGDMLSEMKALAALDKELGDAQRELAAARKAREEAEATDLWDQA